MFRIIFYLLLFFIPLLGGGNYLLNIYPLLGTTIIAELSLLSMLACFMEKSRRGAFKFIRGEPEKFVILFFTISAFSILYSINRWESALRIMPLLSGSLIFFISREVLLTDQEKVILNVVLLSAIFVSLIGIYQVLLGFANIVKKAQEIGISGDLLILARSQTRAFSTFIHPNTMAGYLCIVIPFCMYMIVEEKNPIMRIIYSGVYAVLITSLLFTYSRGGWITCVIGFLLFLYVMLWEKIPFKKVIPIFIAIIIAFLLFFSLRSYSTDIVNRDLPSISERISKLGFSSMSVQGRLILWKGALNIISDNPFLGTGIGTFMHAYPHYQERVFYSRYAHNIFLEIASETGLLGVASFVLLFIPCLKIKPRREKRLLYIFGIISMLLFLLHNTMDFDWESPCIVATFFLLLSIINYSGSRGLENGSRLIIPSERRLIIRYLFSSMLTAAVCLIVLLPFLSDGYFSMARSLFDQGKYEESINEIRNARRFFPLRGEYFYGEAEIYKTMGDVYKKREFYEKGIQYMEKAIEMEPLNPFFRRELGIIYWMIKDYDRAIEEFKKAIEITPGDAFLYYTLGKAYMYLGKLDNAKIELRKAVELEEDYFNYSHPDIKDIFEAHFLIAEIAMMEKDLDSASKELEKNLIFLSRGPNFYHVGRRERNIIYNADTVLFRVYYNLGRVMEEKGEREEALRYYKRAQSINPDDENLRKRIDYLSGRRQLNNES